MAIYIKGPPWFIIRCSVVGAEFHFWMRAIFRDQGLGRKERDGDRIGRGWLLKINGFLVHMRRLLKINGFLVHMRRL